MLRLLAFAALFGCAGPIQADDKKVTLTFLGGAKKAPLEKLKVTIRKYTGDWSEDKKKKLTDGTTDKQGNAEFTLAEGQYYVEIASDAELPYLNVPLGHKGRLSHYDRMIKVGPEAKPSFEFILADACEMILRAVDGDTAKPLPGVIFVTESVTAEDWGIAIIGDNLGVNGKAQSAEVTGKDGTLKRYMGPREGYTYFAWPAPKGYVQMGKLEVIIPTPLGKDQVEHVFIFRQKK